MSLLDVCMLDSSAIPRCASITFYHDRRSASVRIQWWCLYASGWEKFYLSIQLSA
jgi:hypothetical protein